MSPLLIKVLAGLALFAALMLGLYLYDAHQQTLGAAAAIADQAKQALAGERAARVESDRRVVAIQEKADHADVQASAARADADAARTADQRLRVRLAAAERRRAAVDPAAASASAPADTAGDLYADVLSRVLDASRLVGAYADQSRIAGQACEQSYEALSRATP